MMYKISIVDDDEEAILHLENMLQQYGNERNVSFETHKFKNAKDYLKDKNDDSDIIFLDIKMPDMNGLILAKKIRLNRPSVIIIFCTSFQCFAINGYKVNAFGFIVKPAQKYSLYYFLDSAIKKLKDVDTEKIIRIKMLDGHYKILTIREIRYVEVSQHYLFYHVKKNPNGSSDVGEEIIRVRGSMKDVEGQLAQHDFCRCSISYLINLNDVTMIKGNDVYLSETILSISRNYKKQFSEKFMEFISRRGSI